MTLITRKRRQLFSNGTTFRTATGTGRWIGCIAPRGWITNYDCGSTAAWGFWDVDRRWIAAKVENVRFVFTDNATPPKRLTEMNSDRHVHDARSTRDRVEQDFDDAYGRRPESLVLSDARGPIARARPSGPRRVRAKNGGPQASRARACGVRASTRYGAEVPCRELATTSGSRRQHARALGGNRPRSRYRSPATKTSAVRTRRPRTGP